MIEAEQLHARILEELDLSRDIPDEELTELIHRVLDEASGREYIPLGKKAELGRELFNAFRKFDLLQEFLEDDKITEIMINGTENIFLEKEGKLIRSGKRFVSREKLEDVIQQIVAESNRIVNEASPIVDARLPDGARVNVVLGPIALNGPIVTIRKFPKEAITMKQLMRFGLIRSAVRINSRIVISPVPSRLAHLASRVTRFGISRIRSSALSSIVMILSSFGMYCDKAFRNVVLPDPVPPLMNML